MSKRLLWGLALIAVSVLILLLNTKGHVAVYVWPGVALSLMKSIAFLIFITIGVTIGILLK